MLRSVARVFVCSAVIAAGTAWAEPPPSPCAGRGEGYGGMAIFDPDGDSDNELAANAGGAGSVGCLFAPFHFQGDVTGDYADIDKISSFHPDFMTNVGGGGHVGLADPEFGALEVTGAYNRLHPEDENDSAGIWRVGGEGELYLEQTTLGVQGGYLKAESTADSDDDAEGFYGRGLIRFYPTEQLKLEGIGGVAQLDGDVIPQARALVEYRLEGLPLSLFARWEGAFDNTLDQHFATGGIRVYLFDAPATLRETDRRYFRESCVNFLSFARTC